MSKSIDRLNAAMQENHWHVDLGFYNAVVAIIESIESKQSNDDVCGWISVDDKQPDFKEPVVYCIKRSRRTSGVGIAYRAASDKWNPEMESTSSPNGFTHWTPLPELPRD